MLLQRAQVRSFAQLERIRALHRRADADMQELERVHHALELTARIDPLTGAGNRRRLDEDLRAVRAHIHRSGMTYGLLEIDLDHFKADQRRAGHLAGDDVLRRVVEALQGTLRAQTRSTAMAARSSSCPAGRHEDGLSLPRSASESVRAWASRILDVATHAVVTVSVGATLLDATAWDARLTSGSS